MKKIFLVFILFKSVILLSQKKDTEETLLNQLLQKNHPVDSTAKACYLLKKGKTTFSYNEEGWVAITEIKYRIKIYNKEGLEYANQKFNYYSEGSTREKVYLSDAITYNLENGKIQKIKLKSENEFKEDINENWSVKKLSFPSVKEGSVIEFTYKLVTPFFWKLDDYKLQYEIPLDYVEYDIYIPEYFQYRTILTGYEFYKTKNEPVDNINFKQVKYSYLGENIPAIDNESFVHNIDNYLSAVKYELVTIRYSNTDVRSFSLTWEDVVKKIYDNQNFGKELNFNNYFEEDLNLILKNTNTRDEKINAVFNFVKNNITWNGKYGYSCNLGVKKAYKEKKGNVADINLMLVAMLRYAGIEANPIILSTRSNGISFYPSLSSFNYVIAGVEVLNDVILLDASNKFCEPDLISLDAVNWSGRIIRKNGSSAEIDLMNIPISKEINKLLVNINEDGLVKGRIRRQFFGYNSFIYRNFVQSLSKETKEERIEKKYTGIDISNYQYKEIDDYVLEDFEFEHNSIVEKIGNKLYVSPALFFEINENPFKTEDRKYPIDFEFTYKDNYSIFITIPEGYIVESLPKPVSFTVNNKFVEYSLNITENSGKIQLIMNFSINTVILPPVEYKTIKAFYDNVINSQTEKIILKKV